MPDHLPIVSGILRPNRAPAIHVLVCLVAMCVASSTSAFGSTASLKAQQIPSGLIPDVSTLARFPASGLSLSPGLYGDLEASPIASQAAIFAPGGLRTGLLYCPLDPQSEVCDRNAPIGAFLSLPAGALRLGAAVRGCSQTSVRLYSRDSTRTEESSWWATLGAGLPLGPRSYIELAFSGGRMGVSRYASHVYEFPGAPDSTRSWIIDECLDVDLSYGTELRWKHGLGQAMTGFGLLGYRWEDFSVKRSDINEGIGGDPFSLVDHLPRERALVFGALALRGQGPAGSQVTVGVSGQYIDGDLTEGVSLSHPSEERARERLFETQVAAFVGLALEVRPWCDLYAGLSGNYLNGHSVTYRMDPTENGLSDEERTWSLVRGGFRLHSKTIYVDTEINSSVSASDPFAALSVGWRF